MTSRPAIRQGLARLANAYARYRRPLWLQAQRLLRRPLVSVEDLATGLRFRCLRDADRMLGETFHSRVYDVPLAPVRAGDVVIDVGANHGFTTCHFAHRGARVIAIEPDPTVFELLVANVEANGLRSRVTPIRGAVAACSGSAELIVSKRLGGGCSTINPGFARAVGLPVHEQTAVTTLRLADLIAEHRLPRVRLLKLDCEGTELEILAGLDPPLLDTFDSMAIEYHPEAYPVADLVALLLSRSELHVAKVASHEVPNANLQVVHRRVIEEWSREG